MGKKKHLEKIASLFEKSPVVSSDSISRIVKSEKQASRYGKQLTRNLILSGRVKRLSKGCYTAHEDPSLAVFCFKPAYLGLQDAISFHNLWEQETVPVIITARKARPGLRRVIGANALVRRIDRKYFFGFEYKKQGDFYLPFSDIEKTFIDMIYFRQRMDKHLISSFREKIDKKKLKRYLGAYPESLRRLAQYKTNTCSPAHCKRPQKALYRSK